VFFYPPCLTLLRKANSFGSWSVTGRLFWWKVCPCGYYAKNCISLVFRKYRRAQTTPHSDLYCRKFLYAFGFLHPL